MKQTFDVKGMTCAACQAHVEKAAGKLDGVKSAQVSLMLGRMEVEYDENAIDAAKICDAVTREGYPASVHGQTQQVAAQPQAEKASAAPLVRLIATAALSILLFYIAMGPMLGLPQMMARKRTLRMVSTEMIMVMHSSVRMGIMPESRGMPKSCMGTAARSAIMRASTSSEGSSSPTWRLPIRRMPAMMSR